MQNESFTFIHPNPIELLSILANRYAIRQEEKKNHFTAYLDFDDILDLNTDCPETSTDQLFKERTPVDLSFSGFIGFFSYPFLCANMGVPIQPSPDDIFHNGLFARPRTLLHIRENNVEIESSIEGRAQDIKVFIATFSMIDHHASRMEAKCNIPPEQYQGIFQKAKEEILNGNTYQIKISQRFESHGIVDPTYTFKKLLQHNPAPESFVFCWDDFALISCSPETVIHKEGNQLLTKPIGGTYKFNSEKQSLEETIQNLKQDPKEQSEHNMLIDLERNDLSRVCKPGTVNVDRHQDIEVYKHLCHFVSTISGELQEGVRNKEILEAMLPGGTITGCPKYKTIELIDQFEPTSRGPYTGSFGLLHDNGDMHLNLIIRTIINFKNECYIPAGGGIVVDSDPEYELQENRTKAQALIDVLEQTDEE